jgi:tRNA G18 (ribose-2'-O)-methylase SpoU
MPQIEIQSIDDPRLLPYGNLRGKQTAREMGLFIAEGLWLVQRLLESEHDVHSILVEARHVSRIESLVAVDTPIFVATKETVERLVGFDFHRGVLACGVRPKSFSWQEIARERQTLRVVVCDRICDQENLGGLIRNAAAFAADLLVIGPGCADAFSRRTARVSMGASFTTPISIVDNLVESVREMSGIEIDTFATVLSKNSELLSDVEPPDRWALVFGNEGSGIAADVVSACTRCVHLPMASGTDSLNVATSAGVFMYQFTRSST